MISYEILKCGLNFRIYLIMKEKEKIFSVLGRVWAHRPQLGRALDVYGP
jgi:hypothetical protein